MIIPAQRSLTSWLQSGDQIRAISFQLDSCHTLRWDGFHLFTFLWCFLLDAPILPQFFFSPALFVLFLTSHQDHTRTIIWYLILSSMDKIQFVKSLAVLRSTNFILTHSRSINRQHLQTFAFTIFIQSQVHWTHQVSASILLLLIFIREGRLLWVNRQKNCLILGGQTTSHNFPHSTWFLVGDGVDFV